MVTVMNIVMVMVSLMVDDDDGDDGDNDCVHVVYKVVPSKHAITIFGFG